jgi:hypothetical protein
MPSKHYSMSPSGAKRWLNCPGSLKLSEGIESKSSVWANEGTQAHDIAEQCLRTGVDAAELTDNGELASAVQEYLDQIRSIKDNKEVLVEQIEKTVLHPKIEGFGGTPDHVMMYKEDEKIVLHIHDYKHGAGVMVDALENEQALCYLAILDTIFLGMPSIFRVTIVQPRISSGDTVDTWELGPERLSEFTEQILAVRKQDHLHAGDWCRWCPALQICPEVKKQSQRAAQQEFGLVADDTEELLEFMRLAPAIKAFLEKVPQALLQKARTGADLPGYKVIERLSNRKWNPDLDIEGELRQLGVEEEEYLKKTLQTPPQLEKVLKGRGISFQQLIVRESNGHAVVPESARGKAVDVVEFPELKETNE